MDFYSMCHLYACLWIIFFTCIDKAVTLMCYECFSTKNPDCGRYFRPYSVTATPCKPEETMCALQRQDEIPGEQVAAIVRGCYAPGQLGGLNSSIGCRRWTNPDDGYTALYCFCPEDLCNSAQPNLPTVSNYHKVITYALVTWAVTKFAVFWNCCFSFDALFSQKLNLQS